jgi:uncharacterized protein
MSSPYPPPSDPGRPWNTPQGPNPGGHPGGGELVPSDDRNWAVGAHIGSIVTAWFALGLIAPLVVMLVRGGQSPFVRRHAVESLNFQINAAVLVVVFGLLIFVGIGLVLLPLYGLYYLVCVVLGTVAASQGREFRYPATVRIVT